jgi:O-antigen/teichoic acid export membrane protein
MRWTVWLSALAVPFSVGSNLLLARIGPQMLGVYGVLSVYVGLIASFFYFGGDTVVIRFIPDCREGERASFLVSYLGVILAVLSGCLVVVYFCPVVLRVMLGDSGEQLRFLVICLAPLPIAFSMILASLKGMLEIRFSQIMSKLLPISTFIAYVGLYLTAERLMIVRPFAVIWTVYLLPMAVLGAIGAIRLFRLFGSARLRFFLPRGFWSYALATQQVGILFFLAYRLDYVLVLNYGGLELLGQYVAVMTVAGLVAMVNGFFMETLLPSLTNMLASGNTAGAAQVYMMHMRILLLVATAISCAIMVLAVPATSLMGTKYQSIQGLIILTAMIQGIANPGVVGGTLLASVGQQRLGLWSCALHLALFTGLFFLLWPDWKLAGAVIAYAVAVTASCGSMIAIALRVSPIFPSVGNVWLRAALLDIAVCIISLHYKPLGVIAAALVWIGAMASFILLARYNAAECKMLAWMFIPGFASPLGGGSHEAVASYSEPA